MYGLNRILFPDFVKQLWITSKHFKLPPNLDSSLYSQSVVDLGLKLFPAFALALNLPENFFADKVHLNSCVRFPFDFYLDKVKDAAAIMRLLHYPPQTGIVDDRVQGIGAHTE